MGKRHYEIRTYLSMPTIKELRADDYNAINDTRGRDGILVAKFEDFEKAEDTFLSEYYKSKIENLGGNPGVRFYRLEIVEEGREENLVIYQSRLFWHVCCNHEPFVTFPSFKEARDFFKENSYDATFYQISTH